MATDLYLANGAVGPTISPSFSSSWDVTSSAVRKTIQEFPLDTQTSGASTNFSTFAFSDSNNADQDILSVQYISGPLDAQTIQSQSINIRYPVFEDNNNNNLFIAATARLVQNDGTDYGTPKDIITLTRDTTEIAGTTQAAAEARTLTATTTSVTAVAGDRLVVEIGVGGDPSGPRSHNNTIYIGGGNSVDIADADTNEAENAFFNFATDTITFQSGKYYLPSSGAADNSPSFSSAWDDTTGADRIEMVQTKSSTTYTSEAFTDSGATDRDCLVRQYVSNTLAAGTFPNCPVTLVIERIITNSANQNLGMSAALRLVQSDGTDYGTPKTLFDVSRGIVQTSSGERSSSITAWASEQTIAANDRLVLEIGMGGDPDASNDHDFSMWFGDNEASDWGFINDISGTNFNPFLWLSYLPTEVSGTTHTRTLVLSGVGTNAIIKQAELTKSITGTGTNTITKMVELTKAISAVGTNAITKMAELTKSMSAIGTNILTAVKLFVVAPVMTAIGTNVLSTAKTFVQVLAYSATAATALIKMAQLTKSITGIGTNILSAAKFFVVNPTMTATGTLVTSAVQLILKSLSFTGTGSSTITKMVELTKNISAIGTNAITKMAELTKSMSAIGTLGLVNTVQLTKTFSAIGTCVGQAVQLILRSFSYTATGTPGLSTIFTAARTLASSAIGTLGKVLSTTYLELKSYAAIGTTSITKMAQLTKSMTGTATNAIIRNIGIIKSMTATGTLSAGQTLLNLVSSAMSAVGTAGLSTVTTFASGVNVLTNVVRSIVRLIIRGL